MLGVYYLTKSSLKISQGLDFNNQHLLKVRLTICAILESTLNKLLGARKSGVSEVT